MPEFNFKDEEKEENFERTPRFTGGRGGGTSGIVIAVIAVVVIAASVFFLNHFGILNLWGEDDTIIVDLPPLEEEVIERIPLPGDPVEEIPEPVEPVEEIELPEEPPVVEERPAREEVVDATARRGEFTVQVSAWQDRRIAETQAERIRAAGRDAFIEESVVNGTRWYRVRVGKFRTYDEAERYGKELQLLLETGWWVGRIQN